MSLSYEEALATLKSMFGDQGYTAQDLDAVLRHFGGHMENTGRYSAENLPPCFSSGFEMHFGMIRLTPPLVLQQWRHCCRTVGLRRN